MLSGTTSDQFFRDNLEWLARATNWAKFTAAASLGVIHKGHVKEALNLMSAYLPKDSTGNSPYAEGGGLYALGLIHANHGGDIIDYLINQLRSNTTQTDVCRSWISSKEICNFVVSFGRRFVMVLVLVWA